ncbi:hypothetical protein [Nocardioides bigeumensis]
MDAMVEKVRELARLKRQADAGEIEYWEYVVQAIELGGLLDEHPELSAGFAAAVVGEQDREAALDLLDDVLQWVNDLAIADVLDATSVLDLAVARRVLLTDEYGWADKLQNHQERFAAITAEHLIASHVEGDGDTQEWRTRLVERVWELPPADAWMVMGQLGIHLPEDTDAPDRQSWWGFTFELAPRDVFGADPPVQPLPEVVALAETHAAAYLVAIDRLGGLADSGVRRWVRLVGYSVPGCGAPSCCRPGLWEAAVARRGLCPRQPVPRG